MNFRLMLKALFERLRGIFSRSEEARTIDVGFRRATIEDVESIFDLSVEQAKAGHLNINLNDPRIVEGLKVQIATAALGMQVPIQGKRHGARGTIWVVTLDGVFAGFATVLEDMPGTWNRHVELYSVGMEAQYRGSGLGRFLVKSVLGELPGRRIYARCRAPSLAMVHILQSMDFERTGLSRLGTVTLERKNAWQKERWSVARAMKEE